MTEDAAELARRLADNAEAVCRHYLGNGRREGGAWRVGDVRNTLGRSMFVRLKPSRGRPAGKWTDAATGEHGDLLDVIRESCGLAAFRDVIEEARRFLALPQSDPPLASAYASFLPSRDGAYDTSATVPSADKVFGSSSSRGWPSSLSSQ